MEGTLSGALSAEVEADALMWGIDPGAIAPPDDDLGIWRENRDAVYAFLSVCTQWRMVGLPSGHILAIGLDYASARAGFEMTGTSITPDLWSDIQLIEAGAKSAINGKLQ